jgi:hypothetical protein
MMHKNLIVTCAGICLLVSIFFTSKVFAAGYWHNDFYSYYIASKLLVADHSIYGVSDQFKQIKSFYNLEFHWATGYSYPPFLAFILQPLTLLLPVQAAWGWLGMNIILYGVIVWLIYRRFRNKWMLVYLLTYLPVIGSITSGQVNLLVMFGLYSWLFGPTVWQQAVGVVFAGLVKVYPGLLLFMAVLNKQWRLMLVGLLLTSLGLLLPILTDGIADTRLYFTEMLPKLSSDADPFFTQQSVNAVLARLTINADKTGSLLADETFDWLMKAVVGGMLLFLSWWTIKHQPTRHVASYLWLVGLTMVAGRTTLWNYALTLFGQVYLIHRWRELTLLEMRWLVIGCLCSNVGWSWSGWIYTYMSTSSILERLLFSFLTSFGFLYGLIQFYLLAKIFDKNRHE